MQGTLRFLKKKGVVQKSHVVREPQPLVEGSRVSFSRTCPLYGLSDPTRYGFFMYFPLICYSLPIHTIPLALLLCMVLGKMRLYMRNLRGFTVHVSIIRMFALRTPYFHVCITAVYPSPATVFILLLTCISHAIIIA